MSDSETGLPHPLCCPDAARGHYCTCSRPNLLALRIETVRDELRREVARATELVGPQVPIVVRLGSLVGRLDEILETVRGER